jgi:hypothetical protein
MSKQISNLTNNCIKHDELWELSEQTRINVYLWVLMTLAVAQLVQC